MPNPDSAVCKVVKAVQADSSSVGTSIENGNDVVRRRPQAEQGTFNTNNVDAGEC